MSEPLKTFNWQPSTQQGDNTSPLQREVDQKAALIEKMARAMEARLNQQFRGMLYSDPAYMGREAEFAGVKLTELARAAYEAEHEETKG